MGAGSGERGAGSTRQPALVVLLALILSLLSGGRATSAERRAELGSSTIAISAPVAPAPAPSARKPWETRGHPRKRTRQVPVVRTRKPWETRGHPRKAPTPRQGSANGPRAP